MSPQKSGDNGCGLLQGAIDPTADTERRLVPKATSLGLGFEPKAEVKQARSENGAATVLGRPLNLPC